MLTKRIIPCLDVANGRTVKGVQFSNLKDMGDPVELAERYQVAQVPTFIVTDPSGRPLARTQGAQPAARLARLYRTGQLQLDEMITRRYRLDDINDAYDDLLDGKIVRGIIDYGIA